MQVYIVEYTNEDCTGNQCLQMEIEAPDLETAYEIMDNNYPYLAIDTIYSQEDAYEYDGQPDEAQEWHDFDPDC